MKINPYIVIIIIFILTLFITEWAPPPPQKHQSTVAFIHYILAIFSDVWLCVTGLDFSLLERGPFCFPLFHC